ncbi:DUF1574 family protein [Leptospira levettii]|uniref:DUF1574 family protein n=1 Tax=Leptospira levettii TaxID=2023178 RepID=UPI000C2AE416|nr:DUF1574 family protein [Leptospira levettii]PJZ90643.1 hypothetical protein CH368_00035 [Leptospira levettii]
MKSKYIYLYPFLILCIIILTDKLICIPDVRESGRRNYKAGQNILLGMPNIWKENILAKQNGKTIAVAIGTSRSEILHEWLDIPVKKSTYDKPISFETRTTIKASEFLLFYLILKSMIDSGFKPDVLFLEFSDDVFSEYSVHSYKSKWSELMLHENELMDIFDAMNPEIKRDIISRLLFLGYNYHFKPIQAVKNLITGNRVTNDHYFIGLSSYLNAKRPYSPDNIGYKYDKFPPNEFQKRIVEYSEVMKEHFFQPYQISETETNLFRKIIDLIEKNNIATVIWEPQVHPYYQKIRFQITKESIFNRYTRNFINPNSKNIRHISLNLENSECRYFTDSSHVSPLCVPEIVDKLLQTAKEIPNFQ